MKSLLGNLTSSEKFWTLMKAFLGIYKVKVDTSEVYKTGLKKGQPKFRSELRYDGVRDLLDWSIQLNAYRILLERASFQISRMYIQAIYRDASLRIEEMIILGQYYMAILGDVYGLNCKVFDRSVNHEYTLASYDIEQLVTVEVSVTLIDAESWEALTLKGLGSGQDPFDKSVAKAQTIAISTAWPLPLMTTPKPTATPMRSCNTNPLRKKIILPTL